MPELTYTVSGLIAPDTWVTEPAISCTATNTATTGSFPITVSGGNAGGNYTISYVNGTLTVNSSSSSSAPTTSVTAPSASGDTATVKVSARSTTSSTTAKASVSRTNMDKAVESAVAAAAKQETTAVVEIDVITSAAAKSLEVTLPTSSLKTLAEADNSTLVIVSDIAEVAVDHTALVSLADQATGNTIVLKVIPVAESALTEIQQEIVAEAEGIEIVGLALFSNGIEIHNYNNGLITITLPYMLPTGHSASDVRVYYLGDDGAVESCTTSYADGKVTFTTTHLSKYVISTTPLTGIDSDPSNPSNPFIDVAESDYFCDAVLWAVEKGITMGATNTTFDPNGRCTRAQIVTFLYRYNGSLAVTATNKFTDVSSGVYYANAVAWAVANDVTVGMTDTTFGPDAPCTRAQIVTFLYRLNKIG